MVISANNFQLSCSAVNHDGLPSLLWRQIFTNVDLMKSNSCTLSMMEEGGQVITMDTAGYTDLEPPFWGVLRNLHIFPVHRFTGVDIFSNVLEKGVFQVRILSPLDTKWWQKSSKELIFVFIVNSFHHIWVFLRKFSTLDKRADTSRCVHEASAVDAIFHN